MSVLDSWRWRYALTAALGILALASSAIKVEIGVMVFAIGVSFIWGLAVRRQVRAVEKALNASQPGLWKRLDASFLFRHVRNLSPVFLRTIFSRELARDRDVGKILMACRRVHIEASIVVGLMLVVINAAKQL